MNLCICNNCGNILEDMNPQIKAKEYPNIDVPSLELFYSGLDDDIRENRFWGCPICKTDDYLDDDLGSAVESIIQRKKLGIDCTEQESAEIKGYIKEYKLPDEQNLIADIQLLFPLEYGEALDEMENIKY